MYISAEKVNFNNSNKRNIAFGIKIPSIQILEIATERHLNGTKGESFYQALEALSGQKGLTDKYIGLAPKIRSKCIKMLAEKIPVIPKIIENSEKFFSGEKKSASEIYMWINEQLKILGDDVLEVPTLKEYGLEKSLANKFVSKEGLKKYSAVDFKTTTLYNFLNN